MTKDMLSNFFGTRYFKFKTLVMLFLLILLAAYIPEVLNHLLLLLYPIVKKIIPTLTEKYFIISFNGILILFIVSYLVIKGVKAFKNKGKIDVESHESTKVKNLVIFLSPLKKFNSKSKKEQNSTPSIKKTIEKIINNPVPSTKAKLIDIIKATTWNMPYLAIKHHISYLKKVYVITSSNERKGDKTIPGTTHEFKLFKSLFEYLFGGKILIEEETPNGIDFENLRAVFDIVEGIFQKPEFSKKKKPSLLIDVTGGKIPNSISASVATLVMGRKFQYISTTDLKVNSYDVGYFPEN
ncbi:MAG: hypothetical protein ACOC5T_00685 [Elusimicrobiota bacterium]